jgi:hypothetical protein
MPVIDEGSEIYFSIYRTNFMIGNDFERPCDLLLFIGLWLEMVSM